MAQEVAPFGIRVNAVAPGCIDGAFHERYSTEEQIRGMVATIPQGRAGTAEDCVGAYLFLSSDLLSGYITGQVIEVNGVPVDAATGGLADLPTSAGAGTDGRAMYGLIGKMTATPGQRDALTGILLENLGTMPGCLSYIVAHDPADDHAVWVTEVWTDAESHKASLQLPEVQAAIAKARPFIAGFEFQVETHPVGGFGLVDGKTD